MNMSQVRKGQGRTLMSRVCSILDELDYRAYSSGRVSGYLDYINGAYKDELTLVDPVFFPRFATQMLGFDLGRSLIPKEKTEASADRPDFLPRDLRSHPFVFDTKGTDSQDLSRHFPKMQSYLQQTGARFGIVLNLREAAVIDEEGQLLADLSFSFEKLYRDRRAGSHNVALHPNTKRFVSFLQAFSCQELDFARKVETIAKAKAWTGEETLSLDELTQRIREVVFTLHNDVRSQRNHVVHLLGQDNERKTRIASEIDAIAESMDPKKPAIEISTSSLREMLNARAGTLDARAVDAYFYRVAYFTMTRLLLVRLWEDIGFIDQSLYDGGFEKWYENFNREIRRVLRYAFHLAGERYSWLFSRDNNYTWYCPNDKALLDVLYEFSHFNLGKLNADVLGTIYEEYVDRVDRKNKGQYYTPREVVSFIWDRVGFNHDNAYFRLEDGQRKPRLVFDPATGSGGFLVEAARRLREEATYNSHNLNDLVDVERAIIEGLYGSEISAFAYYITEINLLIQLTPVIKDILEHKHLYRHPEFALSVIHQDSLKLHPRIEKTFDGFPDELRKADEVYERDKRHDIVSLEGRKREAYEFTKHCSDFDYVCANPPYIGEKGHKELFRATVEQYPYWRQYYQGKMDYLYWFVILGLSKLKEGGKLGFITTSYWPTADGAAKLRRCILDNTLIREIVDFGDTRIFEGAPGQHNMIFVLERCSDAQERAESSIKVAIVKKEFEGRTVKERLKKLLEHLERHIEEENFADEYIDVFLSPVRQGELTEKAWNLVQIGGAGKILGKIQQKGTPLAQMCNIDQGIVSGADKATERNIKHLPEHLITTHKTKAGGGIFVLSGEELQSLQLSEDEMSLIEPLYKNSDIDRYHISLEHPQFVIYTTKDTRIDKHPRIKAHLERFRPILENKRESKEGKLPWFSLHWARNQKIFEGEKIVTPNRAPQNTFGLSDSPLYAMSDVFFITRRAHREDLRYVLALLNSALLDVWFSCIRKGKGQTREYVGTPLSGVPIRRIDFDDADEAQTHDRLVELVDGIIEAKKKLATYNRFFPKVRLTRLNENEPLPDMNNGEAVRSLDPSALRTIRIHPQIQYQPKSVEHFFLKGAKLADDGQTLAVVSRDMQVLTLTAPQGILEYLRDVLPEYHGRRWTEVIDEVMVPTESDLVDEKRAEVLDRVDSLRNEVRSLQQHIDTIVFDLYGLNDEERTVIIEHI